MGELESLLAVLGILYLSECLVWVPRGAAVFSRWSTRRFRMRYGGALTGNNYGSLGLSNPLPPLGVSWLIPPIPCALSPDKVFAFAPLTLDPAGPPPNTGKCLAFAEIRTVEARNKSVFVNGELFLRTAWPGTAQRWAEQLDRLRRLSRDQREQAIRNLVESEFDIQAVTTRMADYRAPGRRLRILGNILFVYLFLLGPALVLEFGFLHIGWALILGLLAQTITIALLFRRAHKRLYPEAGEERFKAFLTLLLAPTSGIRAFDTLGRHLMETAHPLCLAREVLSPGAFQAAARHWWRELRYPAIPPSSFGHGPTAACVEWFRQATERAVEKFLRANNLDPASLMDPVVRRDPTSQSYCPRCRAEYITASGECRDCLGRTLERFVDG